MRVKFLSVMLLSVALAAPMAAEAKKGHRHHHRHHTHHHHHHGHQSHHHRHTYSNHYNTQNIYYNQPYPPAPAYGIAAGRYFLGVNTGNVGFVLSGY
ncbi:hypothetical protein AAW31_17935 [Nitrosomonas communis]|nr:hypothetical protein AAW31_17935 [Nitrosomonas communis]